VKTGCARRERRHFDSARAGAGSVLLVLGALVAAARAEPVHERPADHPTESRQENPAPGFVDLAQVAPGIVIQMRYAGAQNFLGRPVRGYAAARCWLSRPAAQALARVAADLAGRGLALMVYDCYRPQRAVDDFVAWARDRGETADPATQAAARNRHYPAVPRSELFHRGYIALRSGHTRGSTVDLTLIPLARAADAGAAFQEPDDCRFGNGTPFAADGSLEMGTAFDCFDERAHADNAEIAPLARHNRQLLRQAMMRRGFAPYAKEWWHFTLAAEPFSNRSFDFEVR
jgi:D-alanyl-D-alanine dipeptidase